MKLSEILGLQLLCSGWNFLWENTKWLPGIYLLFELKSALDNMKAPMVQLKKKFHCFIVIEGMYTFSLKLMREGVRFNL